MTSISKTHIAIVMATAGVATVAVIGKQWWSRFLEPGSPLLYDQGITKTPEEQLDEFSEGLRKVGNAST